MQIATSPRSFFIFDLDDTLVDEFDFLVSGYSSICSYVAPSAANNLLEITVGKYLRGENAFAWLIEEFSSEHRRLDMMTLLNIYRNHFPALRPRAGVIEFLEEAKSMNVPVGLITDGRSITQRNKLKAAGLDKYFEDVVISEEFGSSKPDPANFMYFENRYPGSEFWYFGDNTTKDFIVPAALGWSCVCIKDPGQNIHKQELEGMTRVHLVSSFLDIHLSRQEIYHY